MKKNSFLHRLITASVSAALAASAAFVINAAAEWKHVDNLGDLNNDKEINMADFVALSKHLLGNTPLGQSSLYNIGFDYYNIDGTDSDPLNGENVKNGVEFIQKADINQDGAVDIYDLLRLRSYMISEASKGMIFRWYEDETTTSTTTAVTTTTTTTTTVTTSADFISPPIYDLYGSLPSQGDANLIVFYVDFPDCQYTYEPSIDQIEKIAFGKENTSDKNYPFESMAAFYDRSSKGVMNLQGKVFRYTTKENKSAYENDVYKAKLETEILEAFDSQIDYSEFDADNDKTIDAILISVPNAAGDNDWWPCAGTFGGNYYARYDKMAVGHVIVGNAEIESATSYKNFTSSYLHEMGHCMGLPDYYLYNATDNDFEGMHGSAGYDLMDEAESDFSAASKLMLGWYTSDQIQVYDSSAGAQTFTLTNAQKEDGNCVIIPYGKLDDNYYSEYFILEYTSLDVNNSQLSTRFWWLPTGSGIRVCHIEGTVVDNGWWKYFKYESGEDESTNNNAGRRFIRVIDDSNTDNLYHTGDVISSNISGFNWYDSSGGQTIDPGITITVGEKVNDTYTITISQK